MVLMVSGEERKFLESKCDGRCNSGHWCIFADLDYNDLCPILKDNVVVVEETYKGLKMIY